MKKLLLLLTLSFAVVFTSCGPKNEPVAVANAFAKTLLVDFDMQKCNKYLCADMKEDWFENKEEIEAMQSGMEELVKSMKFEYAINSRALEIGDDWAYVEYFVTSKADPSYNETMEVYLKTEDGKWVVEEVDMEFFY